MIYFHQIFGTVVEEHNNSYVGVEVYVLFSIGI